MAHVVVGILVDVDPANRRLLVGSLEFRFEEGLAIGDLVKGRSVVVLSEERDGVAWITSIRHTAGLGEPRPR
jgi:hypothetical protein